MSILFSNSVLAPLLALILVPLLLHLFARARPPAFRFSSTAFLRRIVRQTQRVRRPREWLLWLLRTAAMAFLVGLFLKPLLFARRDLADPRAPRRLALVVDASASMACSENAQSRFAAACAQAADVLGGLPPGSQANLIWVRSPPQAVYPALGPNTAYLRDALRRARVSAEAGEMAEALRLAVDMLRGQPGRKEIGVVSDFQQTNWNEPLPDIPPDVDVFTLKVGERDAENQALTRLWIEPAAPLAGEAVTLCCEVRNFSPRHRQATVYFEFGEMREKQDLHLAPWAQAAAAFAVRAPQAGEFPVTVRLSEDAFAGDNTRRAVMRVRPFLRCGLVGAEPETARAWRRALDALGWARVETLPADWRADDPYDALLLAGWDGAAWEAVLRHLDGGGTAIWYPAPDTPLDRVEKLMARQAAATREGRVAWQTLREPQSLAVTRPDDPCFSVFGNGEFGNPARGTFRARLALPAVDRPDAVTLMEFADHVPALVRSTRPGTLYLWNLPLQSEASDWAAFPESLAVLGELLLSGRGAGAASEPAADGEPGRRLSRGLDRDAPADEVALCAEDGARHSIEREEVEGKPRFESERLTAPGLYAWRLGEEVAGYSVVNFPARESDLRTVPPDTVLARAQRLVSGRGAADAREGQPLWRYALAFALGLLVLEGMVTVWTAKQ